MKKILLFVLVAMLVASCATTRKPIATNPRPTLTAEDISKIEIKEDSLAKAEEFVKVENVNVTVGEETPVSYSREDLVNVLMDLSTLTGINIIPDNSVEGVVTANIEGMPLESVLKMILYPNGYKYKYIADGNYYIVGTADPENTSFNDLTDPVVIKTNKDAGKVLAQISPYYHPYIKADGQSISVRASKDIIEAVKKEIKIIDKQKRQVEVTAQFVMVEWKKGRALGAQWSDINLSGLGIAELIKGGTSSLIANLTSNLTSILAVNGYDTKINMVAEPRIVVEEGENAEINISEDHMFLILSGGGTAYSYFTTKEVEVGIKMNVQPFLNRDGSLRLYVNPQVSDIIGEREFKNGSSTQKLPIVAKRSTNTVLNVGNGETVAIGGLVNKVNKNGNNGIPFFRKIPIIKHFFSSQDLYKNETELVVFITTRVIG